MSLKNVTPIIILAFSLAVFFGKSMQLLPRVLHHSFSMLFLPQSQYFRLYRSLKVLGDDLFLSAVCHRQGHNI